MIGPQIPTGQVSGRLLPNRLSLAVGKADVERVAQPTRMLLAITATGKHLYQGTVPAAVVAKKNKAARIARRAAR